MVGDRARRMTNRAACAHIRPDLGAARSVLTPARSRWSVALSVYKPDAGSKLERRAIDTG